MHKLISATAIAAVMASGFAFAQAEHGIIRGEEFQGATTMHLEFSGPEDQKVVKGIPLSADIVNTHVQHLADGNTIKNEDTSLFYRDAEGRTRRENKLMLAGQKGGDAPTMIMINDPVAHTRFILNKDIKSANRLPGPPPGAPMSAHTNVFYAKKGEIAVGTAGPVKEGGPDEQKEDLGTQTIEGFVTRGTRSSHVIPAGKIGNEKPITVTTESWYSDDLGMELLRVHKDPWAGEITTKVTNVRRGEQDESLFTPPADYKVEKGGGNTRIIQLQSRDGKELPPPPPPQD